MFGKPTAKLDTMVGTDTTIKGELTVQGTLRIDGAVEGDIRADWVVVGESGKVRGNIRGRAVIVGGHIDGNIEAAEIVELKDKAQVYGEICTAKLTMSEGAVFEGQSSMKRKKETPDGQEGKVKALGGPRPA